ncbi:hypothetical protein BGZ52_007299, partial [Haplosporangium bisporale]
MAPVDSNILVLREKPGTSHIDYMNKYADQEFALNTNATGSGFLSHATEVNTITISSSSSSSFSASALPPEYPVCETLSDYKNNWPLGHTKTQTTFPCFKTFNVYSEKPIEPCAQKVLGLTIFDSPVEMYQFSVNMAMSNPGILDKLEASIDTAQVRDVGEGDLLAVIFRRDILVPMPEARIKVLEEYYVVDSHSESEDPHRWYYEAKGKGKHAKRTSPISVLHIKNHTKVHKQHKKLAQELVDFQSDFVPFERRRFKEIINNHSKGLPDFIKNKVLVAGVFNTPMPPANAERSPPRNRKYSVLVLGNTQAGKTALVEYIMSYATPSYTVYQSLLGDGTFSKTERTRTVHTKSSLPSYEVYDKASGSTIDFNPDEGDEEDIRDLLFTREDNIGRRPAPGAVSDAVEFELLDTPGLNQDQDVVQAADIVDGIISTRSFNLILIVVNIHDPLTAEQLLALRYFSKILRGPHSNIA